MKLKPLWIYEIKLWGSASKFGIADYSTLNKTLFEHQLKLLGTQYQDLGIPFIQNIILEKSNKQHNKLKFSGNIYNIMPEYSLYKIKIKHNLVLHLSFYGDFFSNIAGNFNVITLFLVKIFMIRISLTIPLFFKMLIILDCCTSKSFFKSYEAKKYGLSLVSTFLEQQVQCVIELTNIVTL